MLHNFNWKKFKVRKICFENDFCLKVISSDSQSLRQREKKSGRQFRWYPYWTLKTHYCLQSFIGLTPTGGLTHLDRKNLIVILVAAAVVVVVAVVDVVLADKCCACGQVFFLFSLSPHPSLALSFSLSFTYRCNIAIN